jgi:hypothetical protein
VGNFEGATRVGVAESPLAFALELCAPPTPAAAAAAAEVPLEAVPFESPVRRMR